MLLRTGTNLILLYALSLSQGAALASHQDPDFRSDQRSQLPTVSQVIDRFLQAVGGRSAWLKIKTQYSSGTIEAPGASIKGTYEIYAKAPDKTLVVMSFANGQIRFGFDGRRSWSQTPQDVAQYDPPAKQAARKRDNDFYKYLHFGQHFPNAKVVGKEEVEGVEAYVVEATPGGEKLPERLYFNVSTGIIVRRDTTSEDNEGKKTTDVQYYDD